MAITINEGTQTNVASDLVGATEYPVMKMDVGAAGASSLFTGTLGAVTNLAGGTITKVEGGTVGEITLVKTAGTLSAGDNNIGNVDIVSGTQQTLGTVGVVNSVAAGTQQTLGTVGVVNNLVTGTIAAVTSVTNLASGTLAAVTSVTNLVAGTITKVEGGTLALVTTVSNLTNGSVILQSGTLTTGSLSNVAMLNAGTLTTIPNIPGGTLALVTRVGNLGTIESGSVIVTNLNAGTVTPFKNPSGSVTLTTHTLGTAAGTTWGTLIAPVGAGTYVYLQGISIVARSGTPDCAITTNVAGSTGAGVFARGAFVPSGGIARDFNSPIQVGTNGTIAYMILNGTADFAVNYWVGT